MADGSTTPGRPDIRSQARGGHWIAWVARPDGKPLGAIVQVARTQKEAEERATRWAATSAEWAIVSQAS